MCSYLWFFCIVALLAAELQANVLDVKKTEARRCHRCLDANETSNCEGAQAVECPAKRPYCATEATVPNFTQSLTCSAASKTPCSLTFKRNNAFQMTCICTGHLCNAPFSTQLQNELLSFVTKLANNTHSELIAVFLNSSVFVNVTKAKLYKALTVGTIEIDTQPLPTKSTTVVVYSSTGGLLPRAEALKQAATVPPDDDEDDGEGSGTFDEHKSQLPASPAAPSSFLPEQNHASGHQHILSLITILLHIPLVFKYYY